MSKNKGIKALLDPSKIWFHLLLAIAITIFLVLISMLGLRIFTHHGSEIEMPDFVGQNASELINNPPADFLLADFDYVYDKSVTDGTVLKQNPEAGEMVKVGRSIYLTVASSTPPMVKMVELRDVSLKQAEIMLKAAGLELGDVIYKASQYDGVVLEQLYKGRAVAAGAELHIGDRISLVVAKNVGRMEDDSDMTEDFAE